MASLRFDEGQRFSCRQCGRCCRRGWDIAVTGAEVEGYRRAGVARAFRDEEGPEGKPGDGTLEPFEPLGVPGLFRIRKRADGACGFLSDANRCRIHEELGAQKKPLSCRMFPFAIHPGGPEPVLTVSLSCPTVAEGVGASLGEQKALVRSLAKEWQHAFPAEPRAAELIAGRTLEASTLDTLRQVLQQLLERKTGEGCVSLRENVGRMARYLDDLTRRRVLKLAPAALAEYVSLTGTYAVRSDKPLDPRPPSPVARLLGRGMLFAVLATREQAAPGMRKGLRLSLRLRLARLLAHVHGLAPAPEGLDHRRIGRVVVDLDGQDLQPLVHGALRNALASLGTGRRPVIAELSLSVGLLRAALLLGAARAAKAGRPELDRDTFLEALVETADLAHAEGGALLGAALDSLSGGVEALYLFASPLGREAGRGPSAPSAAER
jgi:Fe-S-cluster containining protein